MSKRPYDKLSRKLPDDKLSDNLSNDLSEGFRRLVLNPNC